MVITAWNLGRLFSRCGPMEVQINGKLIDPPYHVDRIRGIIKQHRKKRNGDLLLTTDGHDVRRKIFQVDPETISLIRVGKPSHAEYIRAPESKWFGWLDNA